MDDEENEIDYDALEEKYGPKMVEFFTNLEEFNLIADLNKQQNTDMYNAIEGVSDLSIEETRARLEEADSMNDSLERLKKQYINRHLDLFN